MPSQVKTMMPSSNWSQYGTQQISHFSDTLVKYLSALELYIYGSLKRQLWYVLGLIEFDCYRLTFDQVIYRVSENWSTKCLLTRWSEDARYVRSICSNSNNVCISLGFQATANSYFSYAIVSLNFDPSQRVFLWIDVYVTMTCGAAARTATVAMTVKAVKVMRQSLSSTMAANFQSFSIPAASSSSLSLSVITCDGHDQN